MVTLGKNIAALSAQRSLDRASRGVATAFERLASGQRINRASDDAAGLTISSSLGIDARVLAVALRNISDGVSMLSIADSALESISGIVQRQKELAEQAANGTYTLKQREALDREAYALTNEFNRIVQSTKFNGRGVLDLSTTEVRIQAGTSGSDSIRVALGSELDRTVGSTSFSQASYALAGTNPLPQDATGGDFNSDGKMDLVLSGDSTSMILLLGNGDGSFLASTSFSGGNDNEAIATADLNNDGILDVAFGANVIAIRLGNGNGTFVTRANITSGAVASRDIKIADFNGDGKADIVSVEETNGKLVFFAGNGDGTFNAEIPSLVFLSPTFAILACMLRLEETESPAASSDARLMRRPEESRSFSVLSAALDFARLRCTLSAAILLPTVIGTDRLTSLSPCKSGGRGEILRSRYLNLLTFYYKFSASRKKFAYESKVIFPAEISSLSDVLCCLENRMDWHESSGN